MAISSDLPEGTDRIETGAGIDRDAETGSFAPGVGNPAGGPSGTGGGDKPAFDWNPETLKAAFSDRAQTLFEQAGDHARSYVAQGMDRTTGALDDLVRMVEDAAAQIDDKIGNGYGDYVRQASGAIAGFADTIRMKDPDQVFDDAREAVRKSPAIAIGAAAALGFALARIAKAGIPAATGTTTPADGAPKTGL